MNTLVHIKSARNRCRLLLGAILIATSVHASELSLNLERYFTLAYNGDSVRLAPNETAIIVSALPVSSEFNYQTIEYKRGTNDFVTLALPLGGTFNPMPLAGPGVVRLNDPAPVGVVGLKIVKVPALMQRPQ